MPPKPLPTEPTPINPKVKIEMGKRKSGLSAPKEEVDVCRHEEVLKRILAKPKLDQYVCRDCEEAVLMVILNFSLMTHEVFEQFKIEQAKALQAAQRRQKTGLMTPDEARQQKQQQEQRK